jgi:hypothetical protein
MQLPHKHRYPENRQRPLISHVPQPNTALGFFLWRVRP